MRTRLGLAGSVNLDYLTDLCEGDRHEMRRLSQLYIRTVTTYLKQLAQAIQDETPEAVTSIGHNAAGCSAMIGMVSVIPFFKELEKQGLRHDLSPSRATLEETQAAFKGICEFLDSEDLLKKPKHPAHVKRT